MSARYQQANVIKVESGMGVPPRVIVKNNSYGVMYDYAARWAFFGRV